MVDNVKNALIEVAQDIGADPAALVKLIQFESSFDPMAKNPRSSARGLIQFIDSTARDMGFRDSLDLVQQYPTVTSQLLGPVRDYLKKYGPYPTEQSLYMSVFYPAAMDWPPYKHFPEWVKKSNPGINTPSDYVAKVNKIAVGGGVSIVAIGGAIIIIYLFTKGRQ